jgi:hypothetical protein
MHTISPDLIKQSPKAKKNMRICCIKCTLSLQCRSASRKEPRIASNEAVVGILAWVFGNSAVNIRGKYNLIELAHG